MQTNEFNRDVIRERAYQKWRDAGAPQGDGLVYWLDAESEISYEHSSMDPHAAQSPGDAESQDAQGGISTSSLPGVPDKERIIGSRG